MTVKTGPRNSALLRHWTPLVLYMFVVFVVSIRPVAEELPGLWDMLHMDKLVHAAMYWVMGILSLRAIANTAAYSRRGAFFLAFALSFFYGGFIELCQGLVPYRSASIMDAAANGAGAFLGAYTYDRWR